MREAKVRKQNVAWGTGAVMGALASAAHAGVVFTPDNQVISSSSATPDMVNLDIDHDGNTDFTFSADTTNGLQVKKGPNVVGGSVVEETNSALAVPFNLGDAITSLDSTGSPATLLSPDGLTGEFPLDQVHYVGVQFVQETAFEHGAIPFEGYVAFEPLSVGSTVSGEILGYAYDDVPGATITAGAVPEPASLALLALGAAGLGMYRRRAR